VAASTVHHQLLICLFAAACVACCSVGHFDRCRKFPSVKDSLKADQSFLIEEDSH
jgi:hypothetical protein